MKNIFTKNSLIGITLLFLIFSSLSSFVYGQNDRNTTDINSPSFRLLICDGPPLPTGHPDNKPGYVPCDFKGLMQQIQHLINIALIAGILVAICALTYAGFLYISGQPENIKKARNIFPALFKGFIIMLLAWFIVYQLIFWLTGSNTFSVLLGK